MFFSLQSLWLENQALFLRDIPRPPKPGEALIRVRLAGICGMDLELVRGYYPFTGVPGHEFVREVVEIMESDDSSRREPRNLEISESAKWIGKRVVGEINVSCGECEQCKNDRFTYCENRTVLGIVNLGALRQVDDEDRPLAEF